MTDDDDEVWSAVAAEWAELWGDFADSARRAVIAAAGVSTGSRVLDVGCGSGELLAMVDALGAVGSGTDPSRRMLAIARARAPRADLRHGCAESLPWPAHAFDVVTAFNSLQFAEDTDEALAELARVVVPGGLVAVSNWAERELNDLDTIETALADAAGDEPRPDGDLRVAGGLERLFADGGLELERSALVTVPWEAPDDDTLVRGVLLGEDRDGMERARATVLAAAAPFRTGDGGYHLSNAFRYAVARTAG
ncbi:MAG: SAM-dependent methyltransferase [Microbacteriaceae bacterium]|jgi:SAM-dependent methyltransferase|nr:SAM-dependent methyltransferase [Microbacteriaceae bacterium]